MRRFFPVIMIFIVLASCDNHMVGQHKSNPVFIHKEFTVNSNPKLELYNLNGDVIIESVEGNKVIVDIKQIIEAKKSAYLERAKTEVELGFDASLDHIVLYTAQPYDTRPHTNNEQKQSWQDDYHVTLDYTIKIPKETKLILSTVNGDVSVTNSDGDISVNGVNGSIALERIAIANDIVTVNGDINVLFSKDLSRDGRFNTVNGDINVTVPPTLSAECSFKSLNGEFYSDFENYTQVGKIKKDEVNKDGRKTYKISSNDLIKIGDGNYKLDFETLNGNVILKSH